MLKQAYKYAEVQYKKTQQTQHQNSVQEAHHSKSYYSVFGVSKTCHLQPPFDFGW